MTDRESKFYLLYVELRKILIDEVEGDKSTAEAVTNTIFSTYASDDDPEQWEKKVRGLLDERPDLAEKYREHLE